MSPFDQAIHDWLAQFGWTAEAGFRLALAAGAGALVGLEREIRGREAGFRTNLLVCLGSALAMVVSKCFAETDWPAIANARTTVDPARIAYGVMTGVGFLGAGAILRTEGSIRGLTTAAALWCLAAIGLTAGFGLYTLTAVAVAMVLVTLWLLDLLEKTLPCSHYRRIVVRCAWQPDCVEQVLARFPTDRAKVTDHAYRRRDDLSEVDIELWVAYRSGVSYRQVEAQLARDPQMQLISAQRQ